MYCCPIWEEKSIYVPVQYVFLIVLTLIVSIGTVGVPGTSTVTTTALFTAAGLPVEIIVLLVPISSVVDMMRTAANVTGAATAAVLVAKSEQLLDREVYDQGKSEEGLSGAVAVGNDPCRNAFYFMSDSDNNIRRFLSLRKNQRTTGGRHLFPYRKDQSHF